MYNIDYIDNKSRMMEVELELALHNINQELLSKANSKKENIIINEKIKKYFEGVEKILITNSISYNYWDLFYETFKAALYANTLDLNCAMEYAQILAFTSVILTTDNEEIKYQNKHSNVMYLIVQINKLRKENQVGIKKLLKKVSQPNLTN